MTGEARTPQEGRTITVPESALRVELEKLILRAEAAEQENERLREALRHIERWAEDELLHGPPELGLILGESRIALAARTEEPR